MATTTPNFGWSVPTSTDLVKDGATAIETLGDSIDASLVDLKGGTTGQVLAKNSNSDMDFTWTNGGDITAVTAGTGITGGGTTGDVTITNAMATAITTNGDLIYGTGSGTFTRRGIGSAGQVLTVSGGIPTWATPSGTLTITQIASGTLSGSSVTVSSLSQYDQLWVRFVNINPSQGAICFIRPNNNTTSGNYIQTGFTNAGSNTPITTSGFGAIGYDVQQDLHATSVNNAGMIHFTNCKNAGFTTFDLTVAYNNPSNTIIAEQTQGVYLVAEAISSLVFTLSGGSFDGGTYTIWGA